MNSDDLYVLGLCLALGVFLAIAWVVVLADGVIQ